MNKKSAIAERITNLHNITNKSKGKPYKPNSITDKSNTETKKSEKPREQKPELVYKNVRYDPNRPRVSISSIPATRFEIRRSRPNIVFKFDSKQPKKTNKETTSKPSEKRSVRKKQGGGSATKKDNVIKKDNLLNKVMKKVPRPNSAEKRTTGKKPKGGFPSGKKEMVHNFQNSILDEEEVKKNKEDEKVTLPNKVLEKVRFKVIEKIISTIPPREILTADALKSLLRSKADKADLSPEERAYLAYYWICNNIEFDYENYLDGKESDSSVEEVMQKGKAVCTGYTALYQYLLTEQGIICYCIDCYAKGYGYKAGSLIPDKTNHQHNGIQLGSNWYLIDTAWGAGDIIDGVFKKDFNNFYFCTDPDKLILTHYPVDPSWQILGQPITKDQFTIYPKLNRKFFELGFTSMSPFGSVVNTDQLIDVEFYYNAAFDKDMKLTAKLYFGEKEKEEKDSVLVEKFDDKFVVRLILNKKGAYLAKFFAMNGTNQTDLKQITEMKIYTSTEQEKKLSFPKMNKNFGKICLLNPLFNYLTKGTAIPFKLYSKTIDEIAIINGKEWKYLKRSPENYFEENITVKGPTVKICEKQGGKFFQKFIFDVQ